MKPSVLSTIIVLLASACASAQQRVWTDKSGAHTISAEFVSVTGDCVELRRPDGTVVRVRTDRLSAEDQAYIAEQLTTGSAGTSPRSATAETSRRTWRNSSGNFSVEADLEGISGDQVQLRKADSSVVSVRVEQLSSTDRLYIRRIRETGETSATTVDLESLLQQNISVRFKAMRLADIIDQLVQQYKAPIYIDGHSLNEVGTGTDREITFEADNQPYERVLNGVLKEAKLSFSIYRNEVLWVGSEESMRYQLPVAVYRLPGPTELEAANQTIPTRKLELPDTITGQIAPRTWGRVGGLGHVALFTHPSPSWVSCLVIRQTFAVHREIEERFSGELQRVRPEEHPFLTQLQLPDVLLRVTSFKVREMPLGEFAVYLQDTFALPFELDAESLAAINMDSRIPVTAAFTGVRLMTALDLILQDINCTWSVTEDGKQVTIHAPGKALWITKDYRVSQFTHRTKVNAQGHGKAGGKYVDSDTLIALVTGFVSPSSWVDARGKGAVEPKGRDMLTIRQTVQGHLAICDLLDQLEASASR